MYKVISCVYCMRNEIHNRKYLFQYFNHLVIKYFCLSIVTWLVYTYQGGTDLYTCEEEVSSSRGGGIRNYWGVGGHSKKFSKPCDII